MPRGRGRFAPSPTGDLHLGSLVAALASSLDAHSRGDEWIVRLEDVDVARSVPGAAGRIFSTLKSLGFHWPEPVLFQSKNTQAYENALDSLQSQGLLFACRCGRGDYQGIYSGHCRESGRLLPGQPRPPDGMAVRLNTAGQGSVNWMDEWQGPQSQHIERDVGDFVLRRKDGFHAYQLAVVVDDGRQDVTRVVRGADLLDNTPRQILLQRLLGLPTPAYAHVPLVVESDGAKLAKSRSSAAIDRLPATAAVRLALHLLRQPDPPATLDDVDALHAWGAAHWTPTTLHGVREIRLPTVD